MERGVLVQDDVTIRMVMRWIDAQDGGAGFLLDGFPRTLSQAGALDNALEDQGGVDRALYISVNNDELIRRLSGRLICGDCQTPYHPELAPPVRAGVCDRCSGELYQREDDKPEAVAKRIQVYLDETAPLVDHYRGAGVLREVDGEGTVEEVGEALMKEVA